MSKTITEWVSAPTETKSTPVAPMRAARSRVIPPLASSGTCPAVRRTATVITSSVMLSSRIRSGGRGRASSSSSCASVVTSTSTGRPGNRPRIASSAGITPPAAMTWLSLTIAMSWRLVRWLTPPPQRTAYFCSARRPGNVLRVSSTRVGEPSRASTQRAVAVATPERWQARLRAVRSATSRRWVRPATRITTSPFSTRVPSGSRSVTVASAPIMKKVTAATPRPATTPGSRAAKTASPRASSEIVAELVGSILEPSGRSSSTARRIVSHTWSGSSPAAVSSSSSSPGTSLGQVTPRLLR